MDRDVEQTSLILFPPFHLDLVNEQLWRDSQVIPLRPKTFAVLRYLVEHAGRLVTKEELLQAVWAGTQVSEAGQRDYIRELRQALGMIPMHPGSLRPCTGGGIGSLPRSAPPSQFQVSSSKFKVWTSP